MSHLDTSAHICSEPCVQTIFMLAVGRTTLEVKVFPGEVSILSYWALAGCFMCHKDCGNINSHDVPESSLSRCLYSAWSLSYITMRKG